MVQEIGTVGLSALRCFHTVARLGGISAAADRLGMAKSGVSRHVALLESHFGVKLLERGGRSVKLTPAGTRLDHRIQSILAEVDLLGDIAREESLGVSGQVNIAATPEFGGHVAKHLFPIIQARHPDLKLVMKTDYAFEDMQDPSTDIAFRIGSFNDDRLVARQLGQFHAWPVAAPKLLSDHPVEHPEDLAKLPCIVFRGDQTGSTWRLYREGQESIVDVTGPAAVRNFTVLLHLAIAGQGLVFLPQFMLTNALASGALVRCLPDYVSRPFPVYLTFRPGTRRIARLDTVIQLAEDHVPKLLSPEH
ncbi:MAG: LysR family transcriptional regulator [Pseudomonadota bacterium]